MPEPKRKLPKYPKDAPFKIVEPKFVKPKSVKPKKTVTLGFTPVASKTKPAPKKRTMKKGPEGRMQPVGPPKPPPPKRRAYISTSKTARTFGGERTPAFESSYDWSRDPKGLRKSKTSSIHEVPSATPRVTKAFRAGQRMGPERRMQPAGKPVTAPKRQVKMGVGPEGRKQPIGPGTPNKKKKK
jgi:hypothetical protein